MIIYTCPLCGSDLQESQIAVYPPVHVLTCTNPNCIFREERQEDTIRVPYIPDYKSYNFNVPSDIPDACRLCSNHPSNGGSGICHCILGLQKMTW